MQIDTKQWKSLAGMVKASLADLSKEWRELSYEVGEEGEWANLRQVQSAQKQARYGEEALESGSKHRISLGFHYTKSTPRIFFTGTGGMKSDLTAADWQKKLCAVLVNGKGKNDSHLSLYEFVSRNLHSLLAIPFKFHTARTSCD